MIVPQFWAEGRVQIREKGKQITVRRFGWSDTSEAEAQANADARAQDALERLLSGGDVPRRELKRGYNGADGVPIREEIIARHGDTIITRNSYGARCLNTPDVLFADVDFQPASQPVLSCFLALVLLILLVVVGWSHRPFGTAILWAVLTFVIGSIVARVILAVRLKMKDTPLVAARKRIERFLAKHPDWTLRIYQTPAGLRVLAMHRTFSPGEPDVAAFFSALGTDPVYVRMCMNQQCFRARLSAKPWRIGVGDHLRPGGVWPVAPERLPLRQAWVAKYEAAAQAFAACTLLETLGNGTTHPKARAVQELHDQLSRATVGLPIA